MFYFRSSKYIAGVETCCFHSRQKGGVRFALTQRTCTVSRSQQLQHPTVSVLAYQVHVPTDSISKHILWNIFNIHMLFIKIKLWKRHCLWKPVLVWGHVQTEYWYRNLSQNQSRCAGLKLCQTPNDWKFLWKKVRTMFLFYWSESL